jgi:hypothetical protein
MAGMGSFSFLPFQSSPLDDTSGICGQGYERHVPTAAWPVPIKVPPRSFGKDGLGLSEMSSPGACNAPWDACGRSDLTFQLRRKR